MGKATIKTHFGFRMTLYLDDWVDQHIYATGTYEDMTALTIKSLLSPGDGCIDVGANVGFFTLLMSKCVGSEGVVWAFEPATQTRARLMHNIDLNQVRHVVVRSEALSNVDGERLFFGGSNDHSGIASLRPIHSSVGSYEVHTSRLSSCLPPSMTPRLVKMDIEGAEFLALQGMCDTLQMHHPDFIIELSDHFLTEMGSSSREVYNLFSKYGYHMYVIDWDGLVPCNRWEEDLPTQFNALFTVREGLPSPIPVKYP